jgi:DNA-binding NtrC family response regulator
VEIKIGDTDELSSIQRAHVVEVFTRERGNKARTARALGLSRRSLYRLLDKYGIEAGANSNPPS